MKPPQHRTMYFAHLRLRRCWRVLLLTMLEELVQMATRTREKIREEGPTNQGD